MMMWHTEHVSVARLCESIRWMMMADYVCGIYFSVCIHVTMREAECVMGKGVKNQAVGTKSVGKEKKDRHMKD